MFNKNTAKNSMVWFNISLYYLVLTQGGDWWLGRGQWMSRWSETVTTTWKRIIAIQ